MEVIYGSTHMILDIMCWEVAILYVCVQVSVSPDGLVWVADYGNNTPQK